MYSFLLLTKITNGVQNNPRIIGAIEWFKAISNPNEGYHNPLDENRLKCMANAIEYYKIPFEHYSLLHYCINNGLTNDTALKTIKYFEKAQQHKFRVDEEYDPEFLLGQMNATDWDK